MAVKKTAKKYIESQPKKQTISNKMIKQEDCMCVFFTASRFLVVIYYDN